MNIGIIAETASTGCWRYLFLLLDNIKKTSMEISLTLYFRDIETCPFEIGRFSTEAGVVLQKIGYYSLRRRRKATIVNKIINILYIPGNLYRSGKNKQIDRKLMEDLGKHDLLFYPWPYRAQKYNVEKPMVFVPHDFIFSHYFGHHVLNYYNRDLWHSNKAMIGEFLAKGTPVVSSNYIARELRNVFFDYNGEVNVIPLSALTPDANVDEDVKIAILNKYEIEGKYILFPTNNMHHKNQGQVISAFYYIKKQFSDIKMIIVGYDTDGVRVRCNSPYYCDHVPDGESFDIKSLGLVSEEDLVVLFKEAELVINASFCEAACGSGLDAWSLGVPTAISNIPPYTEQVNKLGVRTAFFDPRNALDIAESVINLLRNKQIAKENARISKEMIAKYSWQDVAKLYVEVFRKKIANY